MARITSGSDSGEYADAMSHQAAAAQIAAAFGPLLLRQTRAQLYDRLTDGVAGVDDATYPVLSGLARSGSATASRLAEQIGLDRTVTTRHATRLEQAGLITRAADPHDARATVLSLTPDGRDAVATMRDRLETLISDALHSWSPDAATAFAHDLQRLVSALVDGVSPNAS
jgi:DNA-binding MarR family transcriptional regulator